MKNRIVQRLEENEKILSIYFTAGFPKLEDTREVIRQLANSGVDLIEIGLPFSDPLADGPTIQASSTTALNNGMNTNLLFEQLEGIREEVDIPLIMMGYYNPVLQYGLEEFCSRCEAIGIDGLILPDLPLAEFKEQLQPLAKKHGLSFVPLITPQTSDKRIREIDAMSDSFIYMVSSASTTGAKSGVKDEQEAYFQRIEAMDLDHPQIVGFGISSKETFQKATRSTHGAIIGSAFIKMLEKEGPEGIPGFVASILE